MIRIKVFVRRDRNGGADQSQQHGSTVAAQLESDADRLLFVAADVKAETWINRRPVPRRPAAKIK